MSQLRNAKADDVAAFPGSTFVVDDTPPITQCQETQIASATADANSGDNFLTDVGVFTGHNLAGKKITISNTIDDDGTYDVISNTNDVLFMSHTMGFDEFNFDITVQDAGEAYLTRNEPSFQRFTENAGKAHTTKGGQLFVDVASGPMAGACSDTFDPQ